MRSKGIVAVKGLDAIFIGRGDLTAAIEAPSMASPETHELVAPIMAVAGKENLPVIMLSPDGSDAEAMDRLGARAFTDFQCTVSCGRLSVRLLKPLLRLSIEARKPAKFLPMTKPKFSIPLLGPIRNKIWTSQTNDWR